MTEADKKEVLQLLLETREWASDPTLSSSFRQLCTIVIRIVQILPPTPTEKPE